MTSEPPTTKWPNASMTWPAKPSRRTSRVDATFRPSRNSVNTRSSDGKTEKSSGRFTYIAVSRITSDDGDVDGDQQVEQRRGQRHDEQQDDADDAERDRQGHEVLVLHRVT